MGAHPAEGWVMLPVDGWASLQVMCRLPVSSTNRPKEVTFAWIYFTLRRNDSPTCIIIRITFRQFLKIASIIR
jgi:hypothetical protein